MKLLVKHSLIEPALQSEAKNDQVLFFKASWDIPETPVLIKVIEGSKVAEANVTAEDMLRWLKENCPHLFKEESVD